MLETLGVEHLTGEVASHAVAGPVGRVDDFARRTACAGGQACELQPRRPVIDALHDLVRVVDRQSTGRNVVGEESTPLFDGERQVGRRDLQRIAAPQQTGDRQVARSTTAPPVVTPARYGGYFASPTPSGHPSQ